MTKKQLFLLLGLLLAQAAGAGEKAFLTVDRLQALGFVRLDGEQLFELMSSHRIEVKDIETDRVSISEDSGKAGLQRKFSDSGSGASNSLYFLDTRLLARAPRLEGKVERRIVGDAIVATDGIRTYHFRVYRKGDLLFAARDIDNGNVYYEVKLE